MTERHRADLIALLKETRPWLELAKASPDCDDEDDQDMLDDLLTRIAEAIEPTTPKTCPDCGSDEISIDGRGSWLCTAAQCGGGSLK